ncbi:MAG: Signal transduction response regulator, receiver domain [Verrucomicrobia bacterium]|nr:Signal transduction response regulator, receiver domain [Verrucomicrobiota bacterium]
MSRLLLIDDDALFREMLAAALIQAGHTVAQARDGEEGVRLFHAEPVDLVITDLVMPRREGIETMLALHRARPDLPIIAMSGGPVRSSLYLDLAARLGACHTLAKPFATETLLSRIQEALTPPAAPAAP